MSYTCREFGSRVIVHELDHVHFCSVPTGFKCFYSILLLSCAFGRKASRTILYIFVEAKCFMLKSFKNNTKKIFHFYSFSQSYSSFVSAMPVFHCSCQCDAFFQSTEMAQLKAVLPVKGRRKVHTGSRSCKADCTVHCQLSIMLNI